MDIRCRKLKCKYNDHFTCKAKGIDVSKVMLCKMYEPDDSKQPVDTSKHLFERIPTYSPQRDSKTIEIKCSAPCLLNHGGTCVANGITVNDYKAKPCCLTFIKK